MKRLHDSDYEETDEEVQKPKRPKNKQKNANDEKLMELKKWNKTQEIDMRKVFKQKFNEIDTKWFYVNLERLLILKSTGHYYFDFEDKITRKFNLLVKLKENSLYDNYSSNDELLNKIFQSQQPENVKSIIINKLLSTSCSSSEEQHKLHSWINTILNLPTEIKSMQMSDFSTISQSLKNLHSAILQKMTGMDKVIGQVLQAISMIISDPSSNGCILALIGPPGVGKTTISSLIAQSIGMGFGQVACGAVSDVASLIGHSSTYIGSKPGLIVQLQIAAKQKDNVILFDELDKVSDSKIIPIFLQILDKSQNNKFRDAYCPEVDVDLSKNLYIISANSVDKLDPALLDRLKIVNIPGYDVEQKTHIVLRHTIPKLIEKTNITALIDYQVVKKCIATLFREPSGMRDTEKFFSDIYEKLLLTKFMGPAFLSLSQTFDIDKIEKIGLPLIKMLIPEVNLS